MCGTGGCRDFFRWANLSNDMSDREFVTALSNSVVNNVATKFSSQPQYHEGWKNRYRNELKDCLVYIAEDEAAAAPEATRTLDAMGPKAKGMKFTMAVSPLDCMGCTNCVKVCPKGALEMVPTEQEMDQQPVWDYMVENVSEKKELIAANVKGSQFKQPYLEFSGSCAGCAETSYARLVTQLFGDRMYISNATGCSSIWGGSAPSMPYTTNKDGHGPAWANSLFEDNAEYGLSLIHI